MALGIVRGPAFGGKSLFIRENSSPGDVLADFTLIYAAIANVRRNPDTGRFPPRESGDPRLALAQLVKIAVIREAASRGLEGWTTTSSSEPEAVERLREFGATGRVVTVDPGEAVVLRRLAEYTAEEGGDSECQNAIRRWYS